ncbi:transcription factor EC [Pseudonaja textilis]|uniref:transcription factor EC n=1 Tax=Pseudonaja textilis TaxID=8673 RepID=UPI000EAAC628|nr:transcription factor EC [Pseudonaja textilis]
MYVQIPRLPKKSSVSVLPPQKGETDSSIGTANHFFAVPRVGLQARSKYPAGQLLGLEFDTTDLKMPHLTDCSCYQVQAHLENPMRYHIQQIPQHQVKPFLTLDTKLSNQPQSLPNSQSVSSSGSTPIVKSGHVPPTSNISIPESPVTKILTLGGENGMEDVIDDIINMESNFNDEGICRIETPLPIPRVHSSSILDIYNSDQGVTAASMGLTNSSYPSNLPVKRELIDTHRITKERVKKDNHNLSMAQILKIQELEMQARAHGLPIMSSVSVVDLTSRVMRQLAYPEENSIDYIQHLATAHEQHADLHDPAAAFSDPLSHFTDLSFSAALKEQRLEEILLDDTISPLGIDPLLSSMSPAVTKGSSRRSSCSSGDSDDI